MRQIACRTKIGSFCPLATYGAVCRPLITNCGIPQPILSLGRKACGGREAGKCFQHVLTAQRLHSDVSSSSPRRLGPSGPSCFLLHPLCTESGLRAVTLIGKGIQDSRRLERVTRTITFTRQFADWPVGPWLGSKPEKALVTHWLRLEGRGQQVVPWLEGTGPMTRLQHGCPRHAESLAPLAAVLCVGYLCCLTACSRCCHPHLP